LYKVAGFIGVVLGQEPNRMPSSLRSRVRVVKLEDSTCLQASGAESYVFKPHAELTRGKAAFFAIVSVEDRSKFALRNKLVHLAEQQRNFDQIVFPIASMVLQAGSLTTYVRDTSFGLEGLTQTASCVGCSNCRVMCTMPAATNEGL
jgi:hypothetical protein